MKKLIQERQAGCPKCGKEILCKDGNNIIECYTCGHIWLGRRADDQKLTTRAEVKRGWG
jgi:ribosomal protein L37AE/L43A